jgi:hypothetical protein
VPGEVERACVYTCVLGGYESLTEQPAASGSGLEMVCLTDDPELESETWRIQVIDPVLAADAPRSSRHPKMFPERYLPDRPASLYLDNSVRLRTAPEHVLAAALADEATDMALSRHSFHASLWEEATAIERLGFDDPARVGELIEVIAATAPDVLDERPWWGGMIARRHGRPAVRAAMEDWWRHVLRYSRRDQLSLPLVLSRHPGLVVCDMGLDNHSSALHEWPVAARPGRDAYLGQASARRSLVGRAREREEALRARVAELEDELGTTRAERDRLARALEAVTTSRSWRATAPVRALGGLVGRRRRG